MKLSRYLWENPVIVKEIRTRMRGRRAFVLLTAHLVLLALAIGLAYAVFITSSSNTGNLSVRATFGRALFGVVVVIELILVSFISPVLTSGAVSSERERQTFDLIQVTRLSAPRFIAGKYLSGLGFVLLLVLTSLPLMGPAFSIGGVLWDEVIVAILIVLISAIGFAALALLLSCLIRRTLINTAITYAITIFLVFGIPALALILLLAFENIFFTNARQLALPLEILLLVVGWVFMCISPFGTIIGTEVILLSQDNLIWAEINLRDTVQIIMPSPWIPFTIVYLLFGLIAIWMSIQMVNQPEE